MLPDNCKRPPEWFTETLIRLLDFTMPDYELLKSELTKDLKVYGDEGFAIFSAMQRTINHEPEKYNYKSYLDKLLKLLEKNNG